MKKKKEIKIDLNEAAKDLPKKKKCKCYQGTNMNTLCNPCFTLWIDHYRSKGILFAKEAFYQYREIIAR